MATKANQARRHLRQQGVTIKAWAELHGFPVSAVRAVLSGHHKGHYGRAHRIAVALGMKRSVK